MQKEIEEIDRLTSLTNAPVRSGGVHPLLLIGLFSSSKLHPFFPQFDSSKSKLFSELPLSQKTKQGKHR